MPDGRPKPRSQAGRILFELEAAHRCQSPHQCRTETCGIISNWVLVNLVPRILDVNARIFTLRHRFGYDIRMLRDPDTPSHTSYRLGLRQATPNHQRPEPAATSEPKAPALFPDLDTTTANTRVLEDVSRDELRRQRAQERRTRQ